MLQTRQVKEISVSDLVKATGLNRSTFYANHLDIFDLADKTRRKLEQVSENLRYHIEFFRNGLNAIIRLWLAGGCKESPEEMAEVLKMEYRGR